MTRPRLRTSLSVVAVIAVVLALLGVPLADAAPPTFREQSAGTVQPAASNGQLQDVSCPSVYFCMAVGYYVDGAGATASFAEQRTSSGWSLVPTVNLTETRGVTLTDVACTGPTACVAVGDNAGALLAEAWNGSSWHVTGVDLPGSAGFTGVACVAADACFATGTRTAGDGTQALVWRYDGNHWNLQNVERPFPYTALNAVSCTGPGNCTAVGQATRDGRAFAESFGGRAWHPVHVLTPRGSSSSSFDAVSCPAVSNGACVAVGDAQVAQHAQVVVADRSAGGDFRASSASAAPDGDAGQELTGLSCVRVPVCTAVGDTINNDRRETVGTFGARGRSGGFHFAPAGGTDQVKGVSCVRAGCITVGASDESDLTNPYAGSPPDTIRTLARAGRGTDPSTQDTPNPSGSPDSVFTGVSCPSAGFCAASISMDSGGGDPARTGGVAVRRGTTWSYPSTGLASSALQAISCASDTFCMAVGKRGAAGNYASVSVRWNGTSWQDAPMAVPAGSTARDTDPVAVSCTSATFCEAVGNFDGQRNTLIEQWDGTGWHIVPASQSGHLAAGILDAVSCSSATSCLAIGLDGGSSTRAQEWNGTVWTNAAPPHFYADGLSCTSTTFCMAVAGKFRDSASETWDGSGWTRRLVPRPVVDGHDEDSALDAVSCTGPSRCTADGYSFANRVQSPYTATWDGSSWAPGAVTEVSGSSPVNTNNVGALYAISCPDASACTAVGQATRLTAVPLVEVDG